jgi:Protein of unknown function (DUF2628)
MAIYNVLIPGMGTDSADTADRATFIRQGFCWPAFLLGPVWLMWRGLWRALAIWCLAAVAASLSISHGLLQASAGTWLYLLGAVFLGLQGKAIRAAAMERRGFRLVDVVSGSDLTTAESGFFSRCFTGEAAITPASQRSNAAAGEGHVIGLFPEAGS